MTSIHAAMAENQTAQKVQTDRRLFSFLSYTVAHLFMHIIKYSSIGIDTKNMVSATGIFVLLKIVLVFVLWDKTFCSTQIKTIIS